MVFPEQINGYRRESIYSFSKQDDDIEVSYNALDKATVAIKIYSAGDGVEGRIRSEYLRTLQAMSDAKDKTIEFAQEPVRRVGAKYICNGFKATTTTTKKNVSKQITLYECGGWFLKIQIDATHLDSSEIATLEDTVVNRYDPTKLTELKPLPLKSSFLVAPALGKDRERAAYILKSGLKKLEWANNNIAENERASGFPDLYLDMHIAAFQEFAACKNENFSPDNDIAKFISGINKVIKANYLPEFLMKQYSMVMIVPADRTFDFEGYDKWQKENKVFWDMRIAYYVIVFRQPK
jgi:hypothetical protein